MKRALAATALLITACTQTGADSPDWQGDDNAYLACDDMANYINDGQPIAERQQRIDDMNSWAAKSDTPGIRDQGAAVALATADDAVFAAAIETLSQTCLDLGYVEAKD